MPLNYQKENILLKKNDPSFGWGATISVDAPKTKVGRTLYKNPPDIKAKNFSKTLS
jgi:hypothetical protein